MLGYYVFKSKRDVYDKNKKRLLYKDGEYYVGVLDGFDVKIYDELDNSMRFDFVKSCFRVHERYNDYFELKTQSSANNKKDFYKIRLKMRGEYQW